MMIHRMRSDRSAETAPNAGRARRSRARTVTALAAAVAAGGLVAACSPSPSTSAAPPAAATPGAKAHHPHPLAGRIATENGSTWTITTAKGATRTVTITPTTAFGTKKQPATAQSFPVGTQVRVVGKRDQGTVTATRVLAGKAKPAPTAPSPTPSG